MANIPQFLTVQQRLILDHLRHTRGSPLTMVRLIAVLYGDRWDGGPEDPGNIVRIQIWRMRKVLEPLGVRILTIGCLGRGCQGYMIAPEDLDRVEEVLTSQQRIDIDIARSR